MAHRCRFAVRGALLLTSHHPSLTAGFKLHPFTIAVSSPAPGVSPTDIAERL